MFFRPMKRVVDKRKIQILLAASLVIGLIASNLLAITTAYFIDSETAAGNGFQAWSSSNWTQTSQAEFEEGVLNAVDTTSSTDNVSLANVNWYNSNWMYRKKISINHTLVSNNLTDFPVLVSLSSDADLAAKAQNSGDDILFTFADGSTKLNHEIEEFTYATGKLLTWVKVPVLSSVIDTDIYMYYGNASCGSQQNATGVWDSHFMMVQHMKDNPDTAHIADSTSNSNNGTKIGANEPNEVSANISKAQDFDGGNDYINCGADESLEVDYITVEGWAKFDVNTGKRVIASIDDGSNRRWALYLLDSPSYCLRFFVFVGGSWRSPDYPWQPTPDTWYHIVGVKSPTHVRTYINGEEVGTPQAHPGAIDKDPMDLRIGAGNYPGYIDGTIDEVRISNIDRSAEWIQTSYNNQSNPSAFYSVGAEEADWYDSDWSYRRAITIDHTMVNDVTEPSTAYADFPVLVHATGLSNILANGADIRFTASDGVTEIPREIESYSGGTLYAWVKVTLTKDASDATDDVIYMYYGNASASEPAPDSTYGSENVWDANFVMVQHMEDDPDTSHTADSTSNSNNGTKKGANEPNEVNENIDKAQDFDGGDDYISASLGALNAPFTIEAWGYFDSLNQGSGDYDYSLMMGTGNDMVSISRNESGANADRYYSWSEGAQRYGPVLPGQQWLHIVIISNTSSPYHSMYLNGSPQTVDDFTSAVNTNGDLVWGKYAPNNTHWLDGKVDEVRVSNTARSADWITTEYNNQSNPSAFCGIGAEDTCESLFASLGTIASQVLDTTVSGAVWNCLFWDETLQSNTDITFAVRASDTPFAKDADTPTWNDAGGTSPVISGLASGRYLQWRATLNTSDTSNTPTLHEVRVYHY
jgi:hypothetical protein